VKSNNVYLGNKSAFLLDDNGKAYSSKHIGVLPPKKIIADFYTMPLQRSMLKEYRDFIHNNSHSHPYLQSRFRIPDACLDNKIEKRNIQAIICHWRGDMHKETKNHTQRLNNPVRTTNSPKYHQQRTRPSESLTTKNSIKYKILHALIYFELL